MSLVRGSHFLCAPNGMGIDCTHEQASHRGATVGPAFEFEVIPLLEHYESLPANSSHHVALRRGLATDLFTVAEYINVWRSRMSPRPIQLESLIPRTDI